MDFQGTLFGAVTHEGAASRPPPLEGRLHRHVLGAGAWIDVGRDWLAPVADELMESLVHQVPWRAERRAMYDRVVDVPRLLHTYGPGETLPHDGLAHARDALSAHYAAELGEPFVSAGCCFYRDGNDSVTWHGDTFGRGASDDTMVAIVSFGDPRRLALRPRGGGASTGVTMGHGDLVVMGGSCQRTWEHAVPKVAHAGPRLSVQFRPLGVF